MSQIENELFEQLEYFKIPGPGAYNPQLQGSNSSYKFGNEQKLKVFSFQLPPDRNGPSYFNPRLFSNNQAFRFSSNQKGTDYYNEIPSVGSYKLQTSFDNGIGYSFGRKLPKEFFQSQQINQSSKVFVYYPQSNKYQMGKWFENDQNNKNNYEKLELQMEYYPMEEYIGKKDGLWVGCIKNQQCELFVKGQYENGIKIGEWKYFWKKNLCSPFELIYGGSYIEQNGQWVEVDEGINEENILKKLKNFYLLDHQEIKTVASEFLRTPDPFQVSSEQEVKQEILSFQNSIWYMDFQFENEEFLRKCFEKDLSYSQIQNIVTNEDEFNEVKNIIWNDYKIIKETHKQFSLQHPSGNVWSMPFSMISAFASKTRLVGNKTYKIENLKRQFKATCIASIETQKKYRNPKIALCRYQFMEFLVRVSIDKYLEQKQTNNIVESVQMLLDQCLPIMQKFNTQEWREMRYFNEYCDDCLKYYKPLLNNLYNKYCIKSEQEQFMSLDQFHKICNKANKNYNYKQINMAFTLSIKSYIDELENDGIIQMTFIEFMEALARFAEIISLPAYKDMTHKQCKQQPLHIKLERLIKRLAQTCASEAYKQQFGNPQQSIFDFQLNDDD
ncbi:unnamed protein product [Paramecium pentaurelia]|uniref:Uncharacterized protein n=1 Tax=Paramecium pentaurelia TaxID=43138 RepID=A0A8S1TAC8_9CILI|nr:unnamed protein product [Paramecium pentaurelia]